MRSRAVGFLIGLAVGILLLPQAVSAQEAIYIVRHSDPPSTLNLDEILDETPLSESGQQRAKMLAERLKEPASAPSMPRKPGAQSKRQSLSRKPSDSKFVSIRTRIPTA